MAGERAEDAADIERGPLAPEADAQWGTALEDPEHLVERFIASAPDAVDRDRGVERGIRPRQLEHGAEPQVGVRRTDGRHPEELGRGIDARDRRPHASCEAHGEAGPAGDVEQAGSRSDAHPIEYRYEHV